MIDSSSGMRLNPSVVVVGLDYNYYFYYDECMNNEFFLVYRNK